ncbi:MAG: NifU family protein [candidate division WOR-3 bacterium]|jgi:Fe-S cluster biogenesis protein NfuA
MNEETKIRIRQVIEEKIRPGLQLDGGDIELVEITQDGVVRVRLTGSCAHCPFSSLTLAAGVEQTLKQQVPAVKAVEPVF